MPVISSSIPSLVNGVSQQPAAIRLTSQCELLENAYPSVVKGVRKRPPFRHLAKLQGSTFSNVYCHIINRDGVEKYAVFITSTGIQVFSLIDGSQKTVNIPSGVGYLSSSTNPRGDFCALTVADYTFITNRLVLPAMNTGVVSPTRIHEAMFYCRQGNYGTTYSIYVGGAVGTYTTSSTDPTTITTTAIANGVGGALITALGAWGGTVVVSGSIVYVTRAGSDFTVYSTDGVGDTSIVPIKGFMQNFSDLPVVGVNGFTVKITGDNSNPYIGYYVTYSDATTYGPTGTWVETTGPGIFTQFDATTMPWQLVRNGDGTFTFAPASWINRLVGDNSSAPIPTFIGTPINDVFFFRNRLCFLSGENVIMSKAGIYFQFWPDTAAQVLDTDRIDVSVTSTKVATLYAAATFNTTVVLFSNQTQFVLSADGAILSPKTVSIAPATDFEGLPHDVKPLSTGRVIYFGIPRGSYLGIREWGQLAQNFSTQDAPEATAQVPQYIPAGGFAMATSSNDQTMAVLTTGDVSSFYIYKWYYSGDSKVQSAWSRWPLAASDTILGVGFIQTTMYALIQRADGVYLEECVLDLGAQDLGFTFQVNLDRLVYQLGTFSSLTGLTTWTLPYNDTNNTLQAVLGPSFGTQLGVVLNTTQVGTSLTAVGNWTAGSVYIGRKYAKRFRFSTQYVREYIKGGGATTVVSNLDSRIQLNKMSVVHENTGYLRAEVTPSARPMYQYVFTARHAGLQDAITGMVSTTTGTFTFPVLSRNTLVQIDIVNDTYLPSSLQGAEWQGKFWAPSQRD